MHTFYLGTHEPSWLGLVDFPTFHSRRRLARYRTHHRARAPWALDSGGFTELSQHGAWRVSPVQYVAEIRHYTAEIGPPDFAAVQDWMCEPQILRKTGLTVAAHQLRTLASYLELMDRAPELPWLPVLQGWETDDYLRHLGLYRRYGITTTRFGLGSVCRRQGTAEALAIIRDLSKHDLQLHGFGIKLTGLRAARHLLASADSMAWSLNARRRPPLPGHTHQSCANCIDWATAWYQRVAAEAC